MGVVVAWPQMRYEPVKYLKVTRQSFLFYVYVFVNILFIRILVCRTQLNGTQRSVQTKFGAEYDIFEYIHYQVFVTSSSSHDS